MERKHNEKLKPLAKALRKNMTPEEKKLWYQYLKKRPETFLRQKIIGNYIVDFYCARKGIVIEVDGVQHNKKENKEYDEKRTEYLEEYGIKVIRISNRAINQNFLGVCEYLKYKLDNINEE